MKLDLKNAKLLLLKSFYDDVALIISDMEIGTDESFEEISYTYRKYKIALHNLEVISNIEKEIEGVKWKYI